MEVFSEQGSVLKDQLKAVAGKGTFSLWKYLTSFTMDSVCGKKIGQTLSYLIKYCLLKLKLSLNSVL